MGTNQQQRDWTRLLELEEAEASLDRTMAGISMYPGSLALHNHHHSALDTPTTRRAVLEHLRRIPWGWAQENWWDYKVASVIDKRCFADAGGKSENHVYVIDSSVLILYAPVFISALELIASDNVSYAIDLQVYLIEFIKMIKRQVAGGSKVIRWVSVGMAGTGPANPTAYFRHHFTNGTPDSLIHLVLLATHLTNTKLRCYNVKYQIKVTRSIIASAGPKIYDEGEANWDYIVLLEVVVCSLLGSAVPVGGTNVASSGIIRKQCNIELLEKLIRVHSDFNLYRILGTLPPGRNPCLPTSVAMVLLARAQRAKFETGKVFGKEAGAARGESRSDTR
jgi:hypothetical protein